jgi:hypothetical protein
MFSQETGLTRVTQGHPPGASSSPVAFPAAVDALLAGQSPTTGFPWMAEPIETFEGLTLGLEGLPGSSDGQTLNWNPVWLQ